MAQRATTKIFAVRCNDLGAQVLASQAFALACATMASIDETDARRPVEKVAGYPGVTMRRMTPESETYVGESSR